MDPKKLPPMLRPHHWHHYQRPVQIDPYTTVTGYAQTRIDHVTVVSVTTSLAGEIYYHWYRDGSWIASTTASAYGFRLPSGEQIRVDVLATTEKGWNVPQEIAGYPSRQRLWWVASMTDDVEHYRIEQSKDGEGYVSVGKVWHAPGRWDYQWMTPPLVDLSSYTWEIIPVDTAGNDGTAKTIGPTKIVRTPDAPEFQITFDDVTTKVEFASA